MNIDASLLLQAAAAAAGTQQYPKATLYVVATPIGNLADISLRAIQALSLVDAVACEDTRVTAGLLRHLGLHKPFISLHQHNEHEAAAQLVQRLQAGERIAYVSDAGTPAVSDPGAVLVAAVQAAGLRVLPLPGASAAVTALSTAGDAQAQGFRFVGFLPAKGQERRAALQALLGAPYSQVLFEAPHRIVALIDLLAELAPAQKVSVCRELTKQFETVHTAPAGELPAWLAADAQRERGEFVLVLHAQAVAAIDEEVPAEAQRVLKLLAAELPLKQAVALAAEISGASRNKLYELGLAWKKARED
ncbi:16S rRNA (cytidine(1402)-2'-O)-methyltransferase [Paucibacter sp. APW11]|uniref:Ribosomal RNA small subunit methyltransferase I n=1 Tax=Roseateles aquae TaxID=3077235 RepID=A0ABU3PHZ1_9BURK|nr:16S rRNA (cytidine(1402)-2'-O)-methyltransferase [Paucibacter sp. APW11]MDT9002200.1 16S rRNA (cytidine(1402)-2'-O)-methyltransferase [Paucibacter sp. APW11]